MSTMDRVHVFSDGKVLVRYTAYGNPTLQGLIRLTTNGTQDLSFGNGGTLTTGSYYFDILPNQQIVTFDNLQNPADYTNSIAMSRFTSDGQPDLSFGDQGRKTFSFHSN